MTNRTKINQKANRKLKQIFQEKDITRCEMCGSDFGLSFAHRYKRRWFLGKSEELLWDFNLVLLLCIQCHSGIEYDKELTNKVFNELRGEE